MFLCGIPVLTILCSHIWEAMRHIWPDAHWPGEDQFNGVESRL